MIDEAIQHAVRTAMRDALIEAQTQTVVRLSYSVAEAAEALGCGETKVRQLLKDGHLTTVPHMGTRTLIPRAALEDLVSGRAPTSTGGRTTAPLVEVGGPPESESHGTVAQLPVRRGAQHPAGGRSSNEPQGAA